MTIYRIVAWRSYTAIETASFEIEAATRKEAEQVASKMCAAGEIPDNAHFKDGDTTDSEPWQVDPDDTWPKE